MPFPLSIPYDSPALSPYWGAKTSAVNFCEEDYIITRYIGELTNTLTSLAYFAYGVYGLHRSARQNVSPIAALNLPYWGLIGIGICSGAYHATLKYHTQMSDEMSMHAAMAAVLTRLFSHHQPPHVATRNTTLILTGLTAFIIYHCLTDEFILHVILFFTLCVTVGWKTRLVIKAHPGTKEENAKLASLVTAALGNAVFAFVLWNIDVHLCEPLTRVKRWVGLPWGLVLELHGWWHVLTAVSCYTCMAVIEFLTTVETRKGVLGFGWPVGGVLSEFSRLGTVRRNDGSTMLSGGKEANGHVVGNGKKTI